MNVLPYKYYLLIVLTIVFGFNGTDGVALGLVMQDIKLELHLSDTQLGLLTGIAFSLFYGVMGIPIARWADRGNRVTVIALTTAIWSVLIAVCGMANNFVQLMLIRIGVGIGEAGGVPPSVSLIADYFPRAERPRAYAIYMLGNPLALFIGLFIAGWVNQLCGWRTMFTVLGLPAVALAALMRFTLREPRLESSALEGITAASAVQPRLKEVWATLWGRPAIRRLFFCQVLVAFFSSAIGQWHAAFFIRSYGLKTGELGTWLAVIGGSAGVMGTYCGGILASRFAANNERLQFKAMAVATSVYGVLSACVYLAHNYHVAFALYGVGAIVVTTTNGPLFAALQTLVPERMRAISMAALTFSTNLIATGLGPLAAGVLSDALHAKVGEDSLRYTLLAFCPGYFWAAWVWWRAGKTVAHDLQSARENELEEIRARTAAVGSLSA